ncbi:MAG: hypothetical protein LBV40_00570, partial [Methanomicrobiales archaeon]|nr:hypothetical protein [Methanomicrobiales archaeon]
MVRERAALAVSTVLRTAGWHVYSSEYPLDLTAVKGNQAIVIVCTSDPEEIARFRATNYMVHDRGVDVVGIRLLVTFDATQVAPGCVVWYRDEFIRYTGQAAYAKVLGKRLVLPFQSEPTQEVEQGEMNRSSVQNVSIDSPCFESEESSVQADEISVPHLPIQITRGEAEERAGIAGMVTLHFVPVWAYTFECTGEEKVFDTVVSFDQRGNGGINALNRKKVLFEPTMITRKPVPRDTKILSARIKEDEAIEIVTSEVVELLSQTVQNRTVSGQAISYEDKHVSPRRDQVRVSVSEIYLPVWVVKGSRTVEIDAYTSRFHGEADDGAEF